MRFKLLASSGFLTVALLTGCAVVTDPVSPNLDSSLHTLGQTNTSLMFSGVGNLEGFAGTPYSEAALDGGAQNIDGEHLMIWMTNGKRSSGGGWFWGGWEKIFTTVSNLYGSPAADQEWTIAISIRSVSPVEVLNSTPRPFNLQISATNVTTHLRATLGYISPAAIPIAEAPPIFLHPADFTISGSISSPEEALRGVTKIIFAIDNAQLPDGDSMGFVIDYIVIGYK